jgi:replicative DNA helicase
VANEGSPTDRISVSRETLRAELSELELRLTKYLDQQLHEKANKVEIVALATAVQDKANAREFGRLQEAFTRHDIALQDLVKQLQIQKEVNEALKKQAKEVEAQSESKFTKKEKLFGAILAVVTISIQLWVATGGSL